MKRSLCTSVSRSNARMASGLSRYLAMMASSSGLQIQHQARGLGARDADLNDLAAGLLGGGQVVVAVVGLAFQHGGLADAAFAALAVVHRIAAFVFHDLDDGLVGGNRQHAAGLAQ